MEMKNFLNRLDELDIMHPEEMSSLNDLDEYTDMIKKEFNAYKAAGGDKLMFLVDFQNYVQRLQKNKYWKQRVTGGEDIAKLEVRAQRKKEAQPQQAQAPEQKVKEKTKVKTEEGIAPITLGKITREKGNLWKVNYEGQDVTLSSDAILHMLMKDQRGESKPVSV